MFAYYLQLALRGLRRNPVLTGLMVLSIAVGIGAAMTTLTVMHLLSGDPLPGRSQHIFYPQVDASPAGVQNTEPFDMLDYTSAMDLWRAQRADRQALVVNSEIKLRAADSGTNALMSTMLSTHADFFPMFNVPFAHGAGWTAEDDDRHARVAVISADLNDKLFGGGDSVGRILHVRDADLRIVGVLAPWRPSPQYYSVAGGRFAQGDTAGYYAKPADVLAPLSTGLDINDGHFQPMTCWEVPSIPGYLRQSPCVWLQLWVQLDDADKVAAYRRFLDGYVAQQHTLGRIAHVDRTRLRSLMGWLDFNRVVPRDVRLQSWLAVAFLAICLFNTVGLLLAKFLRRGGEIGVRRALGASRGAVFGQLLTEAVVIGLAGGVLGLLLTLAGLWAVRLQPVEYAPLIHLDVAMFAATFALALVASLGAGLFPAMRASRIAPAIQLKSL
ncbi:ABC transporter permease [Pseudoxanthomonas sp. JBR18]|uniref:ABC transporter permease n=1 Tax=Pseudoxanthomonas sp. JBR18 TaxID=2969308 RepID=UPI0023057B64|nr:ABC transporter permease [Pseudoxanthomonas sp. JBR18]WCE02700.1 ABC transporter permease [Pseudoxanthomonas sp. JBR18]